MDIAPGFIVSDRRKMFFIIFVTSITAVLGMPPRLSGRIIGGRPVDIQNYPYQLSLMYKGSHVCGASILSLNYALTAGHCTEGVTADQLSIRAASTIMGQGGEVIQVQAIYRHPYFNYNTIDYDLSLLLLASYITVTTHSYPIDLIEDNVEIPEGTIATVTGWGVTRESSLSLSATLRVIQVPIVNRNVCRREYVSYVVTNRMLCAGLRYGGQDACQGDSGGPMVINNKLAGVISWGYGCARPYYPGVYANIAAMRDFIRNITTL